MFQCEQERDRIMTHRMNGLTRRGFVAGAIAAGPVLATLSNATMVRAQGKTILNARLQRDITVLDPGYMVGGTEIAVQYAVMPRLAHVVNEGGTFTWAPSEYMAALSQDDPTHISFELKSGFKWTNGYGDFTAEDVKYSLDRMLESDWKDKWLALDHVELSGPYSGTIVLKHASPAIWLTTIAAGAGNLVCKAATEDVGGKYTTEIPATCGPYVIAEWTPKQRIVFTRNPDWPGPMPEFDEVHYILVDDDTAAELAYEAGEIDITRVAVSSLPRYTQNPPPDTNVTVAGHLQYAWLGMNTEHPKLQNVKVRQAIQHAVDVDSIIQAAYFDNAPRSFGIVPPGVFGSRSQASFGYDPAKARALMAESGVSGLELELKTLNQQARIVSAQIIQANLAEIGITTKIIPLDSGPFWSLGRESKGDDWMDAQIWIMRFGGALDPLDYFQWFVSDQVGNWNWERWTSEEFDEIYQKLATETDDAGRMEAITRLQEIMDESAGYVWLQHEPEAFIHRAFLNPEIVPTGEYDFRRFTAS